MSKARTLNPYDMEERINNLEEDVTSNKSSLTNLTKYSNLVSGASVNVSGSTCLVVAKRESSTTASDVNAIAFCVGGTLHYLLNSGGNKTPLSASYSNGVTTITNQNDIAVHFGVVVLN